MTVMRFIGLFLAFLWHASLLCLPQIFSLNPSHGMVVGGNNVMIHGTSLGGATAVNFGSRPATSFTAFRDSCLYRASRL